MKRLLLALVVAALLVGAVGATSLNFQDAGDYDSINITGTGGSWVQSTNGVNSYIQETHPLAGTYYILNANALQSTYWAATCVANGMPGTSIEYLDSSYNSMASSAFSPAAGKRYEVQVVGGQAKLYENGILLATSAVMAQNPSYYRLAMWSGVGGASASWDDFIFGDTENKYILGGPETDVYILKKDFVTPASTGFATADGTIITSSNMSTTWAKSNITYSGNESIVLQNVETGTIYATDYTLLKTSANVSWDLNTAIFNSGAPYGRYYVTIPGSGAVSEEIWYLGTGATISFDESTYSGQDVATIIYSVLGAYWDTSTYTYSIDVVSGTTGATMQSTPISASSGTEDYTFTSTDPLGVYYAIVKATKLSDGSVIWMNYDYAELTSYVTIEGYVNDAETGLPISGANINITQNSIINNLTTIADGNYSATNYLSGAPITINATAPLHRQYTYTFTPLSAQTIGLNITLTNTTPLNAGLGIGGVARETAYGRPLSGVSVWLINTTNAETNTKTTSITGWYLCDEGTTCFLETKRPYDVWGEKLGYSNSANYTAVTA